MLKMKVNVKNIIRNPIGVDNLQFRRTTSRYKRKGTFSSNKGYLQVSRALTDCVINGKEYKAGNFVPRQSA